MEYMPGVSSYIFLKLAFYLKVNGGKKDNKKWHYKMQTLPKDIWKSFKLDELGNISCPLHVALYF
jgi:hypothetical protein